MYKNGITGEFLVNGTLEIVSTSYTKTKIKAFTPTITDIKSHGFTITAETSSEEAEIICYTYIVNGEQKQSSNEKTCIVTDLDANTVYNIVVVATDNLGNSKESILVKEKTKDEILFTKEYLEQGQTNGNTQITQDSYNGTDGLSMTGNTTNPAGILNIENLHKWYKEIDITNYNTLEFYARKGQNHGMIYVLIDNNIEYEIGYTDLSTNWTKHQVDLSKYTGVHTISIVGGYVDKTGSTSSNTQYCDIKLNVN